MAVATAESVTREQLLEFVRPRHRAVLITHKGPGDCRFRPSPPVSTRRVGS